MTIAVFSNVGNFPVVRDKLKKSELAIEFGLVTLLFFIFSVISFEVYLYTVSDHLFLSDV